MHFLANENLPLDVVEALRNSGHDVAWIRTDAPGSKDRDILHRAVNEQRILLTFDKDFGDLAFQFGIPASCGIVLFRLSGKFVGSSGGFRGDSATITNRLGCALFRG